LGVFFKKCRSGEKYRRQFFEIFVFGKSKLFIITIGDIMGKKRRIIRSTKFKNKHSSHPRLVNYDNNSLDEAQEPEIEEVPIVLEENNDKLELVKEEEEVIVVKPKAAIKKKTKKKTTSRRKAKATVAKNKNKLS
jgi:hypothetical protein